MSKTKIVTKNPRTCVVGVRGYFLGLSGWPDGGVPPSTGGRIGKSMIVTSCDVGILASRRSSRLSNCQASSRCFSNNSGISMVTSFHGNSIVFSSSSMRYDSVSTLNQFRVICCVACTIASASVFARNDGNAMVKNSSVAYGAKNTNMVAHHFCTGFGGFFFRVIRFPFNAMYCLFCVHPAIGKDFAQANAVPTQYRRVVQRLGCFE